MYISDGLFVKLGKLNICLHCFFSYHLNISIDIAVSAVIGIFTAATGLLPNYKSKGGSLRENLALQNIQVKEFVLVVHICETLKRY